MRRLVAVTLILMATLSLGCRMSINLTTTFLPNQEMDQEMVMRFDDLGDESPADLLQSEQATLDEDGWTQEVKMEDGAFIMRAYKHLMPGDDLFPPSDSGEDSPKPAYDLQVVDLPGAREYRLTVVVPASESAPQSDSETESGSELQPDPELAALGDDMAQAMSEMIKFSWTINLPGEVVETNADTQTETGGIWEFRLDQMGKDRELKLVTRERT